MRILCILLFLVAFPFIHYGQKSAITLIGRSIYSNIPVVSLTRLNIEKVLFIYDSNIDSLGYCEVVNCINDKGIVEWESIISIPGEDCKLVTTKVDKDKNIYLLVQSEWVPLPLTSFLVKLDSLGNLLWKTPVINKRIASDRAYTIDWVDDKIFVAGFFENFSMSDTFCVSYVSTISTAGKNLSLKMNYTYPWSKGLWISRLDTIKKEINLISWSNNIINWRISVIGLSKFNYQTNEIVNTYFIDSIDIIPFQYRKNTNDSIRVIQYLMPLKNKRGELVFLGQVEDFTTNERVDFIRLIDLNNGSKILLESIKYPLSLVNSIGEDVFLFQLEENFKIKFVLADKNFQTIRLFNSFYEEKLFNDFLNEQKLEGFPGLLSPGNVYYDNCIQMQSKVFFVCLPAYNASTQMWYPLLLRLDSVGNIIPVFKQLATLDYKIYPNPFTDKVFVETPNEGDYELSFVNVVGQRIMEYKQQLPAEVNLDKLPKGLYILTIKQNNTLVHTQRLLHE